MSDIRLLILNAPDWPFAGVCIHRLELRHPEGMVDISRGPAKRSPRTEIGYNSGTPAGCRTICPQRISVFMYTSSLAPRIGSHLLLTSGESVCTHSSEAQSELRDASRNASEERPIMSIF